MAESDAKNALAAADAKVSMDELMIPVKGSQMRTLVYKPKVTPTGGCALLLLLHGGAFCFGHPEFESMNCIAAAEEFGCVALSLDYPLGPECKFPEPYYRCWEALQWVCLHFRKRLCRALFDTFLDCPSCWQPWCRSYQRVPARRLLGGRGHCGGLGILGQRSRAATTAHWCLVFCAGSGRAVKVT